MRIRRSIAIGVILALLLVPLAVGYITAPCDAFGDPIILSPHRLRQRGFLVKASTWLKQISEIGADLDTITQGPQPGSVSTAFQLAEQVGQITGRLDTLDPPEAPPEYGLLADMMGQAWNQYAHSAERLLGFYGSRDPQALAEAREALWLGDKILIDVAAGTDALTNPLCREVWRER
jgi:hypothetical protein